MKLRTDVLLRHDGKHVLCTGRGEICGPDEVSGDPTMLHDAMAAHAYKQAVKQVLGYYPESAFPESGESLDCKSASMARHTCNNIEKRAAEILAGWLGEEVAK